MEEECDFAGGSHGDNVSDCDLLLLLGSKHLRDFSERERRAVA